MSNGRAFRPTLSKGSRGAVAVGGTAKSLTATDLGSVIVSVHVNPLDGPAVLAGTGVSGDDGTYKVSLDEDVLSKFTKAGGLVDLIVTPGTKDVSVGIPQYVTVEWDNSRVSRVDSLGSEVSVDLPIDESLGANSAAGGTSRAAGARCYSSLFKWETVPLDDTLTGVGWHQMAKDTPNWRSTILYENTKSSTLQTGYAVSAGVSALSFSASGTTTTDSNVGVAASNSYSGLSGTTTNRKQVITIGQSMDRYRCWQQPTTPPAHPGYWPEYSVVVRPGGWKRDYYGLNFNGYANASCVGLHHLQGPGTFTRTAGSSITIEDAFTVGATSNGVSGSFSGNNTQKMSTTSGKKVSHTMENQSTGNKKLCNTTGAPMASSGNVGIIVGKP